MRSASEFPLHMTVEEYLAFDAAAPEGEKYEFFDGLVVPRHGYDETGRVAMAGAGRNHNLIGVNLGVALAPAARTRGCPYGASDQRVRTVGKSYTYPDFVLVCGEAVYSDDTPAGDGAAHPPVLENPSLLVEILSPSTESVDRGRKLTAYTALASVAEYWVVASDAAEITQFVRTGDGWQIRFAAGLDATVRCDLLGLDVPLADVYAMVEVGEADPYRR